MTIFDFEKFKADKEKEKTLQKAEKIVEELKMVLRIMSLSIEGLSHYNKYVFVNECVSVINSNKVLLEVHLAKYQRAIDKIEEEIANGKLETDGEKDTKQSSDSEK